MGLINSILTWVMQKRIHQIELFIKYPNEVQEELFKKAHSNGEDHEFGSVMILQHSAYEQFKERVPVQTYEKIFPYIERMMRGEQNILWPSEIKWFSKSSGQPTHGANLFPFHRKHWRIVILKEGRICFLIYVNNFPDTKLFNGKGLAVGGSHQINELDPTATSYYGDVSAVIMQNLPPWAQFIRTPSLETALMGNWEEKIEKLALETAKDNVTNIAGVPTWTYLLIQRLSD